MTMKKLARRDLQLLLIIGGVALFLILFFGVHTQVQTQADGIEAQITALMPQLQEREAHYLNLQQYEADTEVAKAYITEQMASYPVGMREEDVLLWMLAFEDTLGYEFSEISFIAPELVTSFDAYVTGEDGSQTYTTLSAYQTGSSTAGDLSYDRLKQALDYIYSDDTKVSLEAIGITYDPAKGELATAMTINQYFIDYEQGVYEPTPLPDVEIGVPYPFGAPTTGTTAAQSAE